MTITMHKTAHISAVEMLDRHPAERHRQEIARLILMHAADYIYLRQDNGNPDNYRAVDLLDDLRAELQDN